jgi:RNA polymerase sigma-70 factor (ECF subfamily)
MTNIDEFEQFMRNYQNMVYSTAMRLLGNETDAADISQEVFLKAYERYGELSGNERAGGWLKTVTRNLCLNHLTRYRGRWRFFSEMGSGDADNEMDYSANLPAPDTREQEMMTAENRAMLEAALQKLPNGQRVPLVLYHFEDLSYEEIAAQMGISLSKVKTDIHRAREALRRKLQLRMTDDSASEYYAT